MSLPIGGTSGIVRKRRVLYLSEAMLGRSHFYVLADELVEPKLVFYSN